MGTKSLAGLSWLAAIEKILKLTGQPTIPLTWCQLPDTCLFSRPFRFAISPGSHRRLWLWLWLWRWLWLWLGL